MTEQKKTVDIAALGEILIDFTFDGNNRHGAALFAQNPGGAPGNVCVQAARLGAKTAFAGKVGEDLHGRLLRSVLDDEGVSTHNLISDPDAFTTLAFVQVREDGEREFSFARKPGADTRLCFEELDIEEIRSAKIFHIGSLSLTDDPIRTTTYKAVEIAKEAGALISYDPNYRASLWPDETTAIQAMRSLIPSADLMKISDEETKLLTDLEDPRQAAAALVDQGVSLVFVTLGKDGALCCSKKGIVQAAGFPGKLADTNGAGDSFWGGVLDQIARANKALEEFELDELERIVRNANACAALTVRRPGAIPALPAADEVNSFLAEQGLDKAF